jgi:predicted GNAT family acetyltransferase
MSDETPLTITREETPSGVGRFVMTQDGTTLGTLDYRNSSGGPIYIDFVEVTPSIRGAGFGKRLVEAAVSWARASRRTIVPLCSYSRSVIERDAALRGVLNGD